MEEMKIEVPISTYMDLIEIKGLLNGMKRLCEKCDKYFDKDDIMNYFGWEKKDADNDE